MSYLLYHLALLQFTMLLQSNLKEDADIAFNLLKVISTYH